MDFLQAVFGFVNAPLFAVFIMGMFWKRATGHGAFWGLMAGTVAWFIHHGLTIPNGYQGTPGAALHGGWIMVYHVYPVDMAQNFWGATCAFVACLVVGILVSVATRRTKDDEKLTGLVYSLTPKIKDRHLPWYMQPAALGAIVLLATVVLNIIFG
jgi:SSS family solute:Na+ symporter